MTTAIEEPTVLDGGVGFGRIALHRCEGRSQALELRVETTEAGALKALSTRSDEPARHTIGSSELQLRVARPSSAVKQGDVILRRSKHNGEPVVIQNAAMGAGSITLTDQRLLGLVFATNVDAPSLRVTINEDDGSGQIVVFTIDRALFTRLDMKKSFTGQLRSVTLSGMCELEFDAWKLMDPHGEFTKPARGELAGILEGFVNDR